jgi:hypothetical protein
VSLYIARLMTGDPDFAATTSMHSWEHLQPSLAGLSKQTVSGTPTQTDIQRADPNGQHVSTRTKYSAQRHDPNRHRYRNASARIYFGLRFGSEMRRSGPRARPPARPSCPPGAQPIEAPRHFPTLLLYKILFHRKWVRLKSVSYLLFDALFYFKLFSGAYVSIF